MGRRIKKGYKFNNKNNMIENIQYSEAEAIAKLGFKELCLYAFDSIEMSCSHSKTVFDLMNYNTGGGYVSKPSYFQVFRWFRAEGYDRNISRIHFNIKEREGVRIIGGKGIHYQDYQVSTKYRHSASKGTITTNNVYESEDEANLECLRELIRIVNID